MFAKREKLGNLSILQSFSYQRTDFVFPPSQQELAPRVGYPTRHSGCQRFHYKLQLLAVRPNLSTSYAVDTLTEHFIRLIAFTYSRCPTSKSLYHKIAFSLVQQHHASRRSIRFGKRSQKGKAGERPVFQVRTDDDHVAFTWLELFLASEANA